ncbi:MAG: hypothetical protein RLY86_3035 [Pseudomonadota bacterium]|jgi:hypothetical protein
MTEHAVLPAVTPRVQFQADGQQAAFGFPFPVFEPGDLRVHLGAAPQDQGFTVTGVGDPAGGTVIFDTAPPDGVVVTLTRALTIARRSDFLESGPFAARTLNDQLDRLTAVDQELAAALTGVLRYPETDLPATPLLPDRALRAGKLLGFDGTGNPVPVPPAEAGAMPGYLPPGTGAVARPLHDKLADVASVRDFGAVGDGVVDDTAAIRAALAAHRAVFLPAGTYRTSQTITLGYGQSLYGVGEASVIQARPQAFDPADWNGYPSGFNAVEMVDGYAALRDLRIVGGASGVKMYGRDGPCVKNVVENVSIWDTLIGIVLDGYDSPDRPCYWNSIARVLVARPNLHGVLLTVEGAGDTPNANKFHDVRVYSLAAPLTGSGFFLSAARFNNSFVDCEANLHPGGEACFRLGAATDQTLIVNFYAESLGALPGIRIDNGSKATSIVNLFSATGGAPIWDPTGARAYTAVNSGFPLANDLKSTRITDLAVEGLTLDTEYVEPAAGGLVQPDITRCTTYFVSAFGGAVEFRLPAAATRNGRTVTVKKIDAGAHPVRVTEAGGNGPDQQTVTLASRFDRVTMVSNGAGWWITGGNVQPANTEFAEGAGVFTPDLLKPLYLVSAAGGEKVVRLPPAAAGAGRTVTIKKSDPGDAAVLVEEQGGPGPDGRVWRLGRQYDFVTATSNGGAWWVTAARALPRTVQFHEAAGLLTIDLRADVVLASAFAGAVEARLPAPGTCAGAVVTVKKTDPSANPVTVTVAGGNGPDNAVQTLSTQYAAITALSNGAAWHILARA